MVDQGGIEVLLELVQFSPQERYEEVWGATREEGGPGRHEVLLELVQFSPQER